MSLISIKGMCDLLENLYCIDQNWVRNMIEENWVININNSFIKQYSEETNVDQKKLDEEKTNFVDQSFDGFVLVNSDFNLLVNSIKIHKEIFDL